MCTLEISTSVENFRNNEQSHIDEGKKWNGKQSMHANSLLTSLVLKSPINFKNAQNIEESKNVYNLLLR